jgi:hypothetical protein
MSVRLSEMKAREKASQVTWDDEIVDFGYFPNAFSLQVAEDVSNAAAANDLSVVAVMLEPIISWWDVLGDDGERMPTDAETMKQFPLSFLMALMEQVGDDQRPPADGN